MSRLHGTRLRRQPAVDAGFTMIEVIASIVVIAIVAAGAIAFFITAMKGIDGQKQRQEAVYLADQQLQAVQALPVGKLVQGRTQASVTAIYSSAAATRLRIGTQDDTANSANYDATATSSSTPAVPVTQTQTVNNVAYALTTFIDVCWYSQGTTLCGPTNAAGTTKEYRASVAVSWATAGCTGGGCFYSTSTLIDPTADPLYNTNVSAPTGTIVTPANATAYNDAATHFVITGNNFNAGIRVLISSGGGTVSNITQPIAGEVDFDLTAGDKPGSYTLSVINTDGGHFQTTLNEVPRLAAAIGWTPAGKTLQLSGGGFESGATLSVTGASFSGGAFAVSSAVAASVTNFTGPANGAQATLTVHNPDGTTAAMTITAPNGTSSSRSTLAAGQTVSATLSGSGFTPGMAVTTTNGSVSVTYTSSALVTLTLTPTTVGSDIITLYNADGGTDAWTYTVNAAPTITNLTPASVVHNRSTNWVLTGTGFQTGATVSVTYNGSARTVSNVSISASQINFTFTTTNSPSSGSTTVNVTVTNPDGGTVTRSFTVTVT